MKLRTLAIMAMLLAGAAVSRADIIAVNLADDHDGALTCNAYGFQPTGTAHEWQISIDGTHNRWETGDILGPITTDTEQDPTLKLIHEIDNDTGFVWTDYHATVILDQTFTLSAVTVSNPGWSVQNVVQPTLVGGLYVGQIDYIADLNNPGTWIPYDPAGSLDFSYKTTFTGTVSFHEELMPSTVPEPSALALLAGGLLGLVALRRRSA